MEFKVEKSHRAEVKLSLEQIDSYVVLESSS